MNLFGEKLPTHAYPLLQQWAEVVVLELDQVLSRGSSRKRQIAKSLLREVLLEQGLQVPLILIDITIEAAVRKHQLRFR